ncbi:MAG: rhodanese-like domain-containing protein [Candidatus Nanopelagicales bacterium]|jgi:rhodanese-related sulfurtransferase|nr:rhodanese-like domain-containing protein [Candidatus Nanopelagicales bacterium]
MRRLLVLLVALLTAGLLAGCSGSSSSSDATVERVDAAAFNEVVSTSGTQVIDVRTPAEFAQGHLEGAVNIDVEDPSFAARIGELEPGTFAVYCRSGNRSQSAVAQMADAGLGSIHELDGGIISWAEAGYPIVQ